MYLVCPSPTPSQVHRAHDTPCLQATAPIRWRGWMLEPVSKTLGVPTVVTGIDYGQMYSSMMLDGPCIWTSDARRGGACHYAMFGHDVTNV